MTCWWSRKSMKTAVVWKPRLNSFEINSSKGMFWNIRQLLCCPQMTSSIHWPHLNYQRSHSHHRNGSVLRYSPHWHRQNPYDYRSPALQRGEQNKTAEAAPWSCPHWKHWSKPSQRTAVRQQEQIKTAKVASHLDMSWHCTICYQGSWKFAKNLKGAICRLSSH